MALNYRRKGLGFTTSHSSLFCPQVFKLLKTGFPKRAKKKTAGKHIPSVAKKTPLQCRDNIKLVGNPEVGNFEYIHYLELPTPLIIVYLV